MKKILEIGGGRTPYFIRYKIPWDLNADYTAIDISEENIQSSKALIKKYSNENNFVPIEPVFIISDASHIDAEDESFNEVVISNTISAPIHKNWDRNGNLIKIKNGEVLKERKIKDPQNLEDPFYIERKNMIQESLRLLKPGGSISIYTDLIIYGIASYERILEELKSNHELEYTQDIKEALRINLINLNKLDSNEFCCCFRAEVLPRSEVHRFKKTV